MTETAMEQAPKPAYDAPAVARILLATGDRLAELLASETALLHASRTAEIGAIGAEKTKLSHIFASGWRQLQKDPGQLSGLEPELRNALRTAAARLDRAAIDNEAALRVGKRATELVLAAIARAVEAQRVRPSYTAGRIPQIARGQLGIGVNRHA